MKSIRIAGVVTMALLSSAAAAAVVQDVERTTHGDEAASPQLSYERRAGEVVLRQYQLGCLSQLTYLLASDGEAMVVDPQRDVEHYVHDARELGARIRYVALTHTNADFVAGHTELAAREGAQILISAESGSRFDHRGMRDREAVALGAAEVEFIATPGHTLDSMSLLVHVPPTSGDVEADPLWVVTGDSLFIGSIGRPDLAQGSIGPMALASRAFDSIQRFRALPDATIVLPAHGAGSLCGAHLSPDTTSTIGREKSQNPYFQLRSRAAFVSRDVSGLPPAPRYFAYNVELNREGPPVVDWTEAMPPALSPTDVRTAIEHGAWVVDLRDARSYASRHLEGSVNVAVRGRLDTWTGIVIPFEAPLVLVGSPTEVREAAFRFKRIGLDRVLGYLSGDLAAAETAGLAVRATELVAPRDLAQRMESATEPILVDVRSAEEHSELAIGEYVHVALTEWERFGDVLDRELPVLFVCNSAYRSSMAVGLAERLGFLRVGSLDGGLDAWLDAGLPVYGSAPVCAAPVHPASSDAVAVRVSGDTIVERGVETGRELELPEPIEPVQLAALLLDQPQSYALLDLRPGWQHGEYHVPGAVQVVPEEVLAHVRTLPRSTRVVLVDRDGTTAWAVAGAVATMLAPERRLIRVLAGGTARFWREVEMAGDASSSQAPPQPSGPTPPSPPPPTATARKRSVGC